MPAWSSTTIIAIAVGAVAMTGIAGAQAPPAAGPKDALLGRLAIELAVDHDPAPISIDADGSALHGVVYDRFAHAQLAARTARLAGTPLDPLHPPASLLAQVLVVVAVPLVCGTRIVAPADVDLEQNGQPLYKWQPATGAAIQKVLAGSHPPAGAIAVQFSAATLVKGETIRITYAGSVCTGTGRTIDFPVTTTPAATLTRPTIELKPEQHPPAQPLSLDVGGIVDQEGRLRYASAPQVTTSFGAAALASVDALRFAPARVNGTPTPWTGGVVVTFYGTGAAGASSADTAPATERTTADVPSLDATTSQCAISSDDTYGQTGSNAIRIGGAAAAGPKREAQYLEVLRGPAGQGLRFHASGPVMIGRSSGPAASGGLRTIANQGTVLDGFEVVYAGLAKPIRLYFDPTRESPLSAPKGFTCAAPITIK